MMQFPLDLPFALETDDDTSVHNAKAEPVANDSLPIASSGTSSASASLPVPPSPDNKTKNQRPKDNSFYVSGVLPSEIFHMPSKQKGKTLEDLEPGQIGTLQVHKSGRVVLNVNGIHYDVDKGTYVNRASHIAYGDRLSSQFVNVGSCVARFTARPDIDQMLEAIRSHDTTS
jgi:RNA polymerase III RPC4